MSLGRRRIICLTAETTVIMVFGSGPRSRRDARTHVPEYFLVGLLMGSRLMLSWSPKYARSPSDPHASRGDP